ncbi:DUF1329 domain-containing protein [Nitrincola tapanii]|uniref:DUF1329 domain-containing protein n=1 Tax=Nitrincola tapanii TaxID=1708751 RepID=A0A5A9W2I7_9GAMM|nr:DUF1329 domain-containing protein [Nitrincola tapanii]KAA0874956.1 DUF1329 domain-containing protein [Nitrincola tapanii]
MFKKALISIAISGLLTSTSVLAVSEQDIENSFFPYKSSLPAAAGIQVGMVINQSNWEVAKEVLDPAMLEQVKLGNYEIRVGETTSFDLHPNYIQATREQASQAQLGAKPGEISGTSAGRPFPAEPSAQDPRAGEKLAWNYKYGYNWGDSAAIMPFYWKYRNMATGQVERTIKFNFHFLNFTRRVNQEPKPAIEPNPSELFRATYVQALEPADVRDTQLLIQRFEDDSKLDNAYLYLGFQRRVRRLSTGQVTDAFLGSDIMIEDFEGYNGRISDMNWDYKGTRYMLMPFFNHNDLELATDMPAESDGYQFVDFTGQGGCFPKITWQLRKVYEVEAKPVDENHPVSRRVHYMDAQTFTIPRTNVYDRSGNLWKAWVIGQAHPDHHLPINKGSGVAIDDAFTMIDVQAQHCTTGQFKGIVDPSLTPPSKMNVQNLRASGR